MKNELNVRFENTPDPNVLRFFVSEKISSREVEYKSSQDANGSPMASKLLGFPWAKSVVIGVDYIAISKQDWVEWDIIADPLADLIKDHVQRSLEKNGSTEENPERIVSEPDTAKIIGDLNTPMAIRVQEILNSEINPAVAAHGGHITLLDVKDNKVYVRLEGGCHGCGMSKITLKQGIEGTIKERIPEVIEVLDTTDHASGTNPYFSGN